MTRETAMDDVCQFGTRSRPQLSRLFGMMALVCRRVADLPSRTLPNENGTHRYRWQSNAKHLLIIGLSTGLAFVAAYSFSTLGSGAHTGVASTAIKGDRLHPHTPWTPCSRQIWPYYDNACLRDYRRSDRPLRTIRILPVDRLSHVRPSPPGKITSVHEKTQKGK